MERVKGLFSARKPPSVQTADLRSQAYDAVVEQEAPIMGSMPVKAGNGQTLEQMQRTLSKTHRHNRRQSTDVKTTLPYVTRGTRDSDGTRPKTAPSRGRKSSSVAKAATDLPYHIPQSSYAPPLPNSKTSTMKSALHPPPNLFNGRTSASGREGSSHIDLLDAVSVRPIDLRSSSRSRIAASGRRDYGEDVADRNIADFGSGDINLNSPQFSYLKNFYTKESRENNNVSSSYSNRTSSNNSAVADKPSIRGVSLLSNNSHDDRGSTNSPARLPPQSNSTTLTMVRSGQSLRPEISQAIVTPASSQSPHTPVLDIWALPQPRPQFSPRTSSITSTTSRDFHYPTNSDRTRTRSLAKSPPPAPSVAVSTPPSLFKPTPPPKELVARAVTQEIISPLSSGRTSSPSTKSYIPSRGRSETLVGDSERVRETSATSTRARQKSANNISILPTRGVVDSPTVPYFPANHQRTLSSASSKSVATYTPAPPLPTIDLSQFQNRGSTPLPTPPMSPSAQSSLKSINASKEYSNIDDEQSHSRQRDSKDYAGPQIVYGGGGGDKRRGMMIESSSEPISLSGVVNLTNTTDSDRTVVQAPAVIHEFVQPQVHHHTEERITREIHTHDVFHRILPVVDVEVLPTKHYLPNPKQDGSLIEISESMVAARSSNWRLSVNSQISAASSTQDTPTVYHRAHETPVPVLSSTKSYVTKDGIHKTEFVWRHPPVLEPSAYEPGETMPMRMNCMADEEYALRTAVEDHSIYASSLEDENRRSAVGEEGLLFNDLGYGSTGMLPGLTEKIPMATINGSSEQAKRPSSSQTDVAVSSPGQAADIILNKREERLREAERQVSKMFAEMNLGAGPPVPPKA